MSLVEQWREIVRGLPDDWADGHLSLSIEDEGKAVRAAAVLGPINPGQRGSVISFSAARRSSGASPTLVERLLRRLDGERIKGTLELVGAGEAVAEPELYRETLVCAWDAAVAGLPPDWSDLYAEVELVSSDWLDRAALLMAPLNPARYGNEPGFRFRVARVFGYGTSPEMARRCFERVDEEEIRGELNVLRVLSETDPVHTQGPVWYVEGRSV